MRSKSLKYLILGWTPASNQFNIFSNERNTMEQYFHSLQPLYVVNIFAYFDSPKLEKKIYSLLQILKEVKFKVIVLSIEH